MKLNELLNAITKQWKQQIFEINARLSNTINGKSMSKIQAEALIKEYETLYSHFVNYTYSMALSCKEQVYENDLEKYTQELKREALHAIGIVNEFYRANTVTQSKPIEQRATPPQVPAPSPVSKNNIILIQSHHQKTPQQTRMQAPSPVRRNNIVLTKSLTQRTPTSRPDEYLATRNHFFQPAPSTLPPILKDNLSQPIQLAQKAAPAVPIPTFDEQYEAGEIFPHDPEKYPQYYICNF
jgi:hypothetical protein